MSSSSKIEKIFKTKEVVHLDFETGEERNVIEVQSIDLIIIDSDDEPVNSEEIEGGLIVEDVDEILDEPEREDSSKTDSWNEQPSSGQTAGNSSLTSETDSWIEENVLFDNSPPGQGVYDLSKMLNVGANYSDIFRFP